MKSKVIALILAVIAAGFAAAYFATRRSPEPQVTGTEPEVFSLNTSGYSRSVKTLGENGEIFLPTDKEGLYFTATLDNKIAFYTYSGGAFAPASYKVQKTEVKLNASNVEIPVTVSYIDAGGLTVGYGVFTSDMNKDVKLYDYAFVKIAKKAPGYGEGYLLLADFDKNNFYKAEKVYSEIYNYKTGDESVSAAVSQNTRMIEKSGTYRQDWTMLTDEFIRNLGDKNYFLSSRYYTQDERGKRTDVMEWSSAYRPKIIAKDIIGTWFVSDKDGIHYLKKDGKGFNSVTKKDDKEKKSVKFEDSYDNYLRSGNFVINKNTGTVTNLRTGDKAEAGDINLNGLSYFSINKDGTKAVLVFEEKDVSGTPTQKIVYCSLDSSGNTETFEEPMMIEDGTDLVWLPGNGSSVMSVRPVTDSGDKAGSVVYTFAQNS